MRNERTTNDNAEDAVSPVIAIILMVAITVVLAGVLYAWVNNIRPPDQGDVTIGGTFRTNKIGLDQNYTFEFTEPSRRIKVEEVTVALLANEVQLASIKLADLPSIGTSQVIYKDWGNDIEGANVTFYDNNGNGNLDSGDKLTIDPDAGQDWVGYALVIQVNRSPAMTKELGSS